MNIVLFGYGKMGKEIEKIALERGHVITLKIDKDNIGSYDKKVLAAADAVIEFSTPASAISNMTTCFEAGVPVVVGTTGWYDKAEEVKKKCSASHGGLFYASNFSIGVNLFFNLNEELARMMNKYAEYNVAMEEIHHIHKLDAPSGTAITLANGILKNVDRKKKYITIEKDARPSGASDELVIHAKREGEVPGTHIVKYQSAIDDIEIMHKAHNRKGFALGAVLAAEFMKGKKGIYGMNDLLKL